MKRYKIGDICSFSKGASVPRERMHEKGDYLYLHYGDLYKGHELYIDVINPQKSIPYVLGNERLRDNQFVSDGDIIYVLTSETVEDLGKALLLVNPNARKVVAGTETTIMRITKRDTVDPSWLNYLLQTPMFKKKIRQYVTGMKVFRVHPRDISRMEIEVPSLDKQRRTAELLDTIHNKIRLNSRVNDYLEELLEVLFVNWVVNQDDVCEKACLLDIANYKNGLAMQRFRPEEDDKGLPVLKIRELSQGYCGKDAERCRSDIDDSILVHDGDLIFSWSGTLLLDFWAGGDAGLNQHLFKVTSNCYPTWFYYMWTKYHMRRFIALAKDRATTMGHIKRSALAESEVLIPSKTRMDELTLKLQPILDEANDLKVQSRKLAELRDALLPKLMSGEIDVSRIDVTQLNNHLVES